jgi:hypothetical protein
MISYAVAFLAAVANASSNVLNRKATREEPPQVEFRAKLILDLLHRRTWLIAVAIMVLSFVLGAIALGTGSVAAVQIIIILELPMTLLGGAWVIGSVLTAGPALAVFLAARRTRSPARRAALLGIAAGLGYGLASAYTKGMTEQFTSGGIPGVLASWQLYAAGVAGISATWLLQNAYHAGRLAAAQPGITLLDPGAATAWGIAVYGDQVRSGGLVLLLAPIPVTVLVGGLVLISRSPTLHAAADAG